MSAIWPLVEAIQMHSKLTRKAITGKGIDRHLLGLGVLCRRMEIELPMLFQDPLFAKSQEWKLSTSGLSAGERFVGTG